MIEDHLNTMLTCLKCDKQLTPQKMNFTYLDFSFTTPLLCCPVCKQVYIPEEFVKGKLDDVEKALEDK